MTFQDLLPQESGMTVTSLTLTPELIAVALQTNASHAACPECGQQTDRVHSHYYRLLADLPWQGHRVVLRLGLRRFRCGNTACSRIIFCERVPSLAAPHARSTNRLTDAHQWIGLVLGGEAGSRLAERLALPTSPDTLLRRVRHVSHPFDPPRVLGVDDFAFHKGLTYGTILVDQDRHRVVDLLPDREAGTLAAWLKRFPQIEVVTRDRATAYAQAVRETLPQAVQVADRWHLLKNLREVLERVFERGRSKLRELFGKCSPTLPLPPRPPTEDTTSNSTRAQSRNHEARRERFNRVRLMEQDGLSKREMMKQSGLHWRTIQRYLMAESCPDWRPGRRGLSRLDAHEALIREKLQSGTVSAKAIHAVMRERGCPIGYSQTKDRVQRLKVELGIPIARPSHPVNNPAIPIPSKTSLAIAVLRNPTVRKEKESEWMETLRGLDPEFTETLDLAASFAGIARTRQGNDLDAWFVKADTSHVPELRDFAKGLHRDEAAVRAGLTLPWSNGPVEGHVNRLKWIKRSMFGRAKFDLLKARVLQSN